MADSFLLKPSPKRMKTAIRNICDSYSHPWDILAELVQNSVDAIKKWNNINKKLERKHFINIEIDQKNKTIVIEDSGCGIDPKDMPDLLAPNETDKMNDTETIGEKGVGLKFAIFSSNIFEIITKSKNGSYKGKLIGARKWKDSDEYENENVPKIEDEEINKRDISPDKTGTKIIINDIVCDDNEIFNMSSVRLEYLLRTKTAVGYTGRKFNKKEFPIGVKLVFIDNDGKKDVKEIKFEYAWPDEFYKKNDVIDFDDFLSKAGSMSDTAKLNKLRGKCLMTIGENRGYKYYCFFVPSRDTFRDMSKSLGLIAENEEQTIISFDIKPGIYVSTKGMPTGINLNPPSSGVMGYWENMFVLVENDEIKFDLGRKTVPSRTQGKIKDIAKTEFGKFTKWKQMIASDRSPENIPVSVTTIEKNEKIRDLESLPSLNFDSIQFLKQPVDQEATVAAIFHELIGAGILKGYRGMREGYKQDYDFWGKYIINKSFLGENIRKNIKLPDNINTPIVIELKFDASHIIGDVLANVKYLEEIDLIVCWDADESIFAEQGLSLQPLLEKDVFYFGSNYMLFGGPIGPLSKGKPLLCLKRFIEDQKRA